MDKLAVVQFLHPGGEDKPGADGVKTWNIGPHKRNFLVSDGAFWADGASHPAELCFWAEWEPEAVETAARPNAERHDPHHVYRPYWVPRVAYQGFGLQTTDPFVFGGEFLYTVCQQPTFHHRLKHLGRGSVILFGSRRGMQFTLDTVFVVRDWVDHDAANYAARLSGRTPPTFEAVTLGPLNRQPLSCHRLALPLTPAASQATTLRLYFGATVTDPVEGMFSFFPCQQSQSKPDGFPCPIIDLPGLAPDGDDLVNPRQPQGVHGTNFGNLSDIRAVWDEVVAQVTGEGLLLGVQANLPPQQAAVNPVIPMPRTGAKSCLPGTSPCKTVVSPSAASPRCVRTKGR